MGVYQPRQQGVARTVDQWELSPSIARTASDFADDAALHDHAHVGQRPLAIEHASMRDDEARRIRLGRCATTHIQQGASDPNQQNAAMALHKSSSRDSRGIGRILSTRT
jgi:hypothetical protein